MTATLRSALALRRSPIAPLLGLAALGWALLAASRFGGAGELLDHDRIFATPSPSAVLVAGFAAAWLVMVLAMMLPVATREVMWAGGLPRGRDQLIIVSGYLAVWECFGVALLAGDGALHRLVAGSGWLQAHEYLISAGVLALVALGEANCAWKRTKRQPGAFERRHSAASGSLRAPLAIGFALAMRGIVVCGPIMLFMLAASLHDFWWLAALAVAGAYQQLARRGAVLAAVLAIAALAGSFVSLVTQTSIL